MDQTPSFTQLSVSLARQGQNFAPLKPLEEAIRNKKVSKSPTRFEQSVRELYTYYLNYEKMAWNEIISMAQLVALFRKGQQLLVRRPYGPGYYVRPIQNDDTYRQTAMNLMSFHAQVCEAKIVASNPSVNMRAGDDTPEAIATAQACRPVVDYYEGQWYDDKFTRREAIRLLTDGMVIHQVRWNPFKGGIGAQSRQIGQQDVELDEGLGECAECNIQASAKEFPQTAFGHQCPQCGSAAVEVQGPQTQQIAQIGMGPQQPIGEPEIITSPLAAWRWDLTKDLEYSSWAIKRQRITPGAITLMLGDISIPDSGSSDQYGLDIVHALAYSGQAFQGRSITQWRGNNTSAYDKRPTMAEFWLAPEDLAHIEIDESETIGGVKIPKGRLSDFFKDPICLVGLNDMSLIVGVYVKESHQKEVVTSHWFMDAESGIGRGMEDTAAVQKRFNAVDGQIYQGLAMTATPAVITDMSILKEDQSHYLFRPGQNIDVSLAMLPPNTKLSDAFYLGNPGVVSQQYIQYGSQFLRQMFQLSALVTEFTDGLIGVDNRTATGAQITAALANSLYGPMLMSKGESRVSIAEKIVCLIAAHQAAGRYYPGKGAAQGRLVSKDDLKGQVIFELVQNSQLPVTPFSQQMDIRVALESLGGPQGFILLKTQEPAMFRQLIAPFNVKIEDEDDDTVSTLCLKRLEQMKEMLQMGVNDPTMLVQSIRPPVSMYEPKHKEKRDWWGRWLDLQSAQEAPMELRAAAEQMYVLHQNMEAQKQMPEAANQGLVAGIGQAAAAAPSAMGAQALQQEQPDGSAQEAEQAQQEIELDAAKHLSDQQHEARMKAMELQGQIAVTQAQGENAIKTAKIAGDNAVRVQKAKPKPKPKGKAA